MPISPSLDCRDPRELDVVKLFYLCAQDQNHSDLWAELLTRLSPKIQSFIRGTLRQSNVDSGAFSQLALQAAGYHETDLFQNTILRLVENGFAAMKRFTGTTEQQLLAYLAVITRSVVRDTLRRDRALKRPPLLRSAPLDSSRSSPSVALDQARERPPTERQILARELRELGKQTIRNQSGQFTARDCLIFELYFDQDLSTTQIAACQGIDLSKTGVEKVLNRLKDRVRSAAEIGDHEASLL